MIKPSKQKIIRLIKKSRLTPGTILLLCLSFWITVMVTRAVIFWSVLNGYIPAIVICGYHIHHFVTGFLLLIIALVLFSREIFSKYIPLALFGSSLGLTFDEFLFWTLGDFNYWSLVNLTAVAVVGTAMVLTYVYTKRHDLALRYEFAKHFKPKPRLLTALLPVILMVLILATMFSHDGLEAAYAKKRGIQTVSDQQQDLPQAR